MASHDKAITPDPDTAKEETAVPHEMPTIKSEIQAWDFTAIAKSYGLEMTTGYDHYPAEFWLFMGMKSYCDPMFQYAKLISALHRLNFFGLNDKADDAVPMSLSALLAEMDIEADTLNSIIDLAVKDWDAMEAGLAKSYDNAGKAQTLTVAEALKSLGGFTEIVPEENGEMDAPEEKGDDTKPKFSNGG